MVIICTARFNTKNLHFAYTVYLYDSYKRDYFPIQNSLTFF